MCLVVILQCTSEPYTFSFCGQTVILFSISFTTQAFLLLCLHGGPRIRLSLGSICWDQSPASFSIVLAVVSCAFPFMLWCLTCVFHHTNNLSGDGAKQIGILTHICSLSLLWQALIVRNPFVMLINLLHSIYYL